MSKVISPEVRAAASLLGKRRLGVTEKPSAKKKASSLLNLKLAWAKSASNGKRKRKHAA